MRYRVRSAKCGVRPEATPDAETQPTAPARQGTRSRSCFRRRLARTPHFALRTRRSGFVLLLTLVIVALASMTAAAMMFRATAEVKGATAGRDGEQAYAAAMSGIRRAMTVVAANASDPSIWQDNPDLFADQLVVDSGVEQWRFTVFAPPGPDQTEPRYGVTDEAARLNLNTAAEASLLLLPEMDSDLVDSLLDWRDGDDETRGNGAEQDYYGSLQPTPYLCKNGPLLTVEELLLIKGFTGPIVYGEDANRSGLLDANEDNGEETFPPDNGDGELDVGIAGLTTTFSYEFDVTNEGKARAYLNAEPNGLDLGATGLSTRTQRFIQLCRAEGVRFAHPAQLLDMEHVLTEDHGRQERKGRRIRSGVRADDLATVLDRLTVLPPVRSGKRPVLGLVNVNTASAKVLAALPNVGEDLADQIVSARGGLEAERRATIAWLLADGVVDRATFLKIAPRLTARSYQYRVRSVGFCRQSGRFRVLEAVIDLAAGTGRLLYARDVTRAGLPVSLEDESMGAGSMGAVQ